MKKSILVLLVFTILTYARAEDDLKKATSNLVQGLSQTNPLIDILSPCAVAPDETVACSKISDNFCAKLWAVGTDGNLEIKESGEKLLFGKSPKSDLSLSNKMDYERLISSVDSMPVELKENKKFNELVAKLKDHLVKENPTKIWGEDLAIINWQIKNEVNQTARVAVESQFPEMKGKAEEDLNINQARELEKGQAILHDKMLEAKYKNDLNWLRVEKIFENARQNIQKVISQSSLPVEVKEKMKTKVGSVQLTLPYEDSHLLGADLSCGSTEVNAYYAPDYNKFTVCAGLFNSAQSTAILSMVISHELAHSVDGERITSEEFQRDPLANALRSMRNNRGEIKSCKDWNLYLKNKVFDVPEKGLRPSPLEEFNSCLIQKNDLKEFTNENLKIGIDYLSKTYISDYAHEHVFSKLATPTINKKGKEIPNEFYLRPDLNNNPENGGKDYVSSPPFDYFFVYSYLCDGENDTPRDIASMKKEDRNQLYKESLDKMKVFGSTFFETLFSYCGNECSELTQFELSRPSGENFADWIASRAVPYTMGGMSVEEKLRFGEQMGALLCDKPEEMFDPDFMIEEKKASLEQHADKRIRRWSLFSPQIADLVNCQLDEATEKGFGQCKL